MPLDVAFKFEHQGIGELIKNQRLAIPPNQRDYLWETEHVTDLFKDISGAIGGQKNVYFLGTVVFTNDDATGIPQVTDGQQRLATTVILAAAIRDHYFRKGKIGHVVSLEGDYLFTFDRPTETNVPKLALNVDDKEYFNKRILCRPDEAGRMVEATRTSHRLIDNAANLAAAHVKHIAAQHNDKDAIAALERWLKFIESDAIVFKIVVPAKVNAFKMFETLNDRGLKVSQAYLVKNFLFDEAGAQNGIQINQKWGQMSGALESLGEDDALMNYLWAVAIYRTGHTRSPDVYEKITEQVTGAPKAIEFISKLADGCIEYLAILQPEHTKWKNNNAIKKLIETINALRLKVQRPAMFAVASKFNLSEIASAFKLILSWSVRFFIVGGGRSGSVQENYASIANSIFNGKITNVQELAKAGEGFAPNDAQFEEAFTTATVSAAYLARYYLRALESQSIAQDEPLFIVNDDATAVTLEHVLPVNPEDDTWSYVTPEQRDAYVKRLGNLALLQATPNALAGNAGIVAKAKIYDACELTWTKMMGKATQWGVEEIKDRQLQMSKIVSSIWPIRITNAQKGKPKAKNAAKSKA